ncbi:hypothetical protein [Anaplasma centrale]|nr:hypothetical protein [Anaplasma centrale]
MFHSRAVGSKYSPEVKRCIGLVLKHGTPGQAMIVRGIFKIHLHARLSTTKVTIKDASKPQKVHLCALERHKTRPHRHDKWVARVHAAPKKHMVLHCRRSPRSTEDIIRTLKAERATIRTHRQWQQKVHSTSSVFKTMLKVKVAHGMDPTQRAGQTKESNIREAAIYGRAPKQKPQNKKGMSFIFKLLMHLLFMLIFPLMLKEDAIVKYALKGLEHQHREKEREKDASRRHGYARIAR